MAQAHGRLRVSRRSRPLCGERELAVSESSVTQDILGYTQTSTYEGTSIFHQERLKPRVADKLDRFRWKPNGGGQCTPTPHNSKVPYHLGDKTFRHLGVVPSRASNDRPARHRTNMSRLRTWNLNL